MVENLEISPAAQTHNIDSRSEMYGKYDWESSTHALCLEHRQTRVAHQSHEIGSEGRPKNCKYWNLHSVVMSDCSLIATRNSHAKHNKSVDGIPERGQTRLLSYSASTSGNENRKGVCWRGTYILFRWKQSMNSKSHANKHKLVTFLIPERRQKKSCTSTSYNG